MVLLFSVFAISVAGCKKKSGVSSVQAPVYPPSCFLYGSTLTGAQATTCCVDGAPRNPLPTGCPRPPGTTPAMATMSSFNSAAATARQALAVADGFEGKGSVGKNNLAAATADTTAAKSDMNPIQGSGAGIEKFGSGMKNKGGGSGGDGGAYSGSGGSLGGFADLSTKPAGDANTQAATAMVGGDTSSLPSGSGSGGRRGGGLDVDGFGSGLASANGTLDMGRAPSSEDGPMAGLDPEDYFTRLKAMDNLFKVVERRYGEKAKSWALRDAAELAARSRLSKMKQ